MYSPGMTSPTRLKSLRLPAPLARSIETEAKRSRRSFSDVAIEMLEESARTRRYRHVVFVGPPGQRRAALAGTGVDVWEVVRDHRALGGSVARLARSLEWVPREKLEEALAYAAAHSEEIDERLEREAGWTEESLAQAMPWSRGRAARR